MKGRIRLILAACLIIGIVSCAALPRRKIDVFLRDDGSFSRTWVIRSISVESASAYIPLETQLPGMLQIAGRQYGMEILPGKESAKPDGGYLALEVWVRERRFTRNLDTLNSISVILTLINPVTEKEVLQAAYTEESDRTVESDYHLFSILERLFKSISKSLKASDKEKNS